MAIIKRHGKNGAKYQVKVKATDGKWLTETLPRLADAQKTELKFKSLKGEGSLGPALSRKITVSEFFELWESNAQTGNCSAGWHRDKVRYFYKYVKPVIGDRKLLQVGMLDVSSVLHQMSAVSLSAQMRLHVFNLLNQLLTCAEEDFEFGFKKPNIQKIKPKVELKESRFLALTEIPKLLSAVKDTEIETAVWLQFYVGLRVGEVQALKWAHVHLDTGKIQICQTYVRKEGRIKDSPKGNINRWIELPDELTEYLRKLPKGLESDFVATGKPVILRYEAYAERLKELSTVYQVPYVGTHGLRHSTAELYTSQGATLEDVRQILGHSTPKVTLRYMHRARGALSIRPKAISLVSGLNSLSERGFPKSFPNEAS